MKELHIVFVQGKHVPALATYVITIASIDVKSKINDFDVAGIYTYL